MILFVFIFNIISNFILLYEIYGWFYFYILICVFFVVWKENFFLFICKFLILFKIEVRFMFFMNYLGEVRYFFVLMID